MKLLMQESGNADIVRILGSSEFHHRIKDADAIFRKCLRDNVVRVEDIQEMVEDVVGLRVVTPNKKDAKLLFDFLHGRASGWFCETTAPVKFVEYTWESGNGYSMKSGYQAFHITFIHPRQFPSFALATKWPIEVQITTKLWHFWSDYSRTYFYQGTGDEDDPAAPYNVAISRILDSAEDLMITTAESFLRPTSAETPTIVTESAVTREEVTITQTPTKQKVAPAEVWTWFSENITELFGEDVRMPNPLFVSKIAYQLNVYDMSLDRLGQAMRDAKNKEKYQELLRMSSVRFLPPYQQILCYILLSLGYNMEEAVAKVNDQLYLLGIRLRAHP